jgi:hypothetical protein
MILSRAFRQLTCLLLFSAAAFGDIFLTPPQGLNPGDVFRLIFLTGTFTNATSADIAFYDNFVNTSANAVLPTQNSAGATVSIINAQNLLDILNVSGVTWQAIVSTPTVNAIDHIGTFTEPVFRLNGGRVANSSADLWDGQLIRSVLNDEFGHDHNYDVWTGTGANGTATAHPLGTPTPTFGQTDYTTAPWMNLGTATATGGRSVYGISSPIIYTPVPEPATLALAALASTAILLRRRTLNS